MRGHLTIGVLARRAGVSAKAIRLYETRGILPPATRAANGYRVYGDDAVERLRFVRQATGLGLTLAEIRDVVSIREGGRPPCTHVHRLLQEKAVDLDRKLRDLVEVRRRIGRSLRAWTRKPAPSARVCPHIETPAGGGRRRERS
jgi:DNA-binding transcriptional MerR regulator